jgi:hypothetical protein
MHSARPWDGIALEPTEQPGRPGEDRRHRSERQLKARFEQRVGVPREQHDCAGEQQPPRIALASCEPRDRRERSRDTRTHDGGLPPDGEHVAADRDEDRQLDREPRQPQQPAEQDHPAGEHHDVLARDRQQVVEPRRPEGVA